MPEVKGTRAAPAAAMVASRSAGALSGEPKCGPPRRISRSAAVSSMIPCETETRRSRAMSAAFITPGLRCGSKPGLAQHQRRHRREIGDRAVVAELRASSSRAALIAQLGLVAEREERLAAACLGARARDREHLRRALR